MIRTANYPKAYAEVYSFINALGEYYIKKIPEKVYKTIEQNRDKSYNPKFEKTQTVDRESMSKEAFALISALNIQYWCTSQEEKRELQQIYIDNTKKEKEKYSYDNLFKNNQEINNDGRTDNNESQQSQAMIEYKESPIRKFINKIKNWFKRKK